MADPEIYDSANLTPTPLPATRTPAWGYRDLLLFVGSVLPAVLLASIFLFLAALAAPPLIFNNAARQLTLQSFLYILLLGVMYFLVTGRYHVPFWQALGYNFPFPHAWLCLFGGP